MSEKLLITIDFAPQTGGVARFLAGYAKSTDADVLADGRGDEPGMKRKRLIWGVWPKWLPLLFWSAFYSRGYKEIAISHILPAGYAALVLRKPYTLILHGLDIILAAKTPWKKFLARIILRRAKEIIVNSRATGNLLEKVFGNVYKFRVEYPKIFPLPSPAGDFKTTNGLLDKRIILSLGRLVARKGQEKILRLMPRILEAVPEAVFVIAGDGPERKNYELRIKNYELEDKVKILGKVGDGELPDLYAACDVFVAPSLPSKDDWEGFGMVCLEVAYFGKPVIVTNTGGLPEAVEDGITGYVAKSDEELLEKIIYILKNIETAKKMGEAGRERVEKIFLITR
jgi:phosphatidylinositol alpha-1,6-mannosyltransferase